MIKMRKRTILGLVIEIGSAVAIGAMAGLFLILRSGRKKQMNLVSVGTVDAIKSDVRNTADDVTKTVHGKTKKVIKDIRHGHNKIRKDIKKMTKNISNKLD